MHSAGKTHFLLFFLCLLLANSTAFASNGRYALVIGNGEYKTAGNLGNPVNDARAVRKAFERLGFEVIYGENLTRSQNINRISAFLDRKKKIKVAAFFYAGHGIQINGENYIIPVDADIHNKTNLNDNVISMNRLLAFMDQKSETSLIFLDACRDNPFGNQIRSGVTRGLLQRTRNLGRFDISRRPRGKTGHSPRKGLAYRKGLAHHKAPPLRRAGRANAKQKMKSANRRHIEKTKRLRGHKNTSSRKRPGFTDRQFANKGKAYLGQPRTGSKSDQKAFDAKPLDIGRGLAEIGGKTGMFVSFATAPGTVAYDGNSLHSPFTEGLIKYINTKAEINLVATRIRNHVNKRTKGLQVPWSSSSLTKEIYLANLPATPSARRNFKRSKSKSRSKKARLKTRTKSRPVKKTKTTSKKRTKTVRKTSTKKKKTTVRSTTRRSSSPTFLP